MRRSRGRLLRLVSEDVAIMGAERAKELLGLLHRVGGRSRSVLAYVEALARVLGEIGGGR